MRYSLLLLVFFYQNDILGLKKEIYQQWLIRQEATLLKDIAQYYLFDSTKFKEHCSILASIYRPIRRPYCFSLNNNLIKRSAVVAHHMALNNVVIMYDPKAQYIAETEGSIIYVNQTLNDRSESVIDYVLAHELHHVLHHDSISLYALGHYIPKDDQSVLDRYKRFLEIRADIGSCLLDRSYTQGMLESLSVTADMNQGPDRWNDHPSIECRQSIALFIHQDYLECFSEQKVLLFLNNLSY